MEPFLINGFEELLLIIYTIIVCIHHISLLENEIMVDCRLVLVALNVVLNFGTWKISGCDNKPW